MDIIRLDLNLLLVLDALLEERSVTGAARRLKVSQPTVSFSLAKLRRVLGDELFVRSASGMAPTPRALRLRAPLTRILDTIGSEIIPAETFEPLTTTRPFTLCLSDIGEMTFLPRLLARLRSETPNAQVVSVSLRSAEISQALEEGRIDLAIGYYPDLDSGIVRQGLFEHRFACLVRRDHPQVGDTLDMETFTALDHLVVSAEGRSQEIFERLMQTLGIARRVVLRTPHFMSAPTIVAQSDLVTTVPRAVATVWAHSQNLRMLEPPLEVPAIPLQQFWHRRHHEDPRTTWLRNLVAELFVGADPTPSMPAT